MVTIRTEQPTDVSQVRLVNELAFSRSAEAEVVDRLRHAVTCADALSLVAEEDEVVVGHILFTPTTVESAGRRIVGMGLAPLAVLPDHQNEKVALAYRPFLRGLDCARHVSLCNRRVYRAGWTAHGLFRLGQADPLGPAGVRSCIHLLAPDGGAGSIAGMDLTVVDADRPFSKKMRLCCG